MFYLSRARVGRLMWQEGLCTERRTSTCNFNEFAVQCVVRKKKFSRSDIQLSTIRNLNPYESKVFYEFLPNNRFVNPNLFIKPVPTPVPVPRTCTCTFLRVTAGSKRTSVQRTSVPSLKRSEPAVTRRKPVAVYLWNWELLRHKLDIYYDIIYRQPMCLTVDPQSQLWPSRRV